MKLKKSLNIICLNKPKLLEYKMMPKIKIFNKLSLLSVL